MTNISLSDVTHRMAYRHDDLPFVLLWSEKSGCTSLFQWMLMQTNEFDEASAFSDWIHDWEHAVMKARPGYADRLVRQLNDHAPAFKLVRDPFDRAVSGFLMLVTLGDDSGHFTVTIRQQIREFVYGNPDVPYAFGFIDALRWLATQESSELDHHLSPQYNPIESQITNLELIRLERFDADIRQIEERFGLPRADLAKASESRHHTTRAAPVGLNPEAIARLHPPIPLFQSGFLLPKSSDFMTGEAVELISHIYRVDIDAYGYEPPVVTSASEPVAEKQLDLIRRFRQTARQALRSRKPLLDPTSTERTDV
jgi:hypothetical protein